MSQAFFHQVHDENGNPPSPTTITTFTNNGHETISIGKFTGTLGTGNCNTSIGLASSGGTGNTAIGLHTLTDTIRIGSPNTALGYSALGYGVGTFITTPPPYSPPVPMTFGTFTIATPFPGQVEYDIELKLMKVFDGKEWIEIKMRSIDETEEESIEIDLSREVIKMQREIKNVL